MNAPAALPTLSDLEIPREVKVGKGWTPFMAEMADHIGAYETLKLLERFGGEFMYVAYNVGRSKVAEIIGDEKAAIFAQVYGGNRFELPLGKEAITRAKRAPVLAAVRNKQLTGGDAARILKVGRSYLSHLVNETDEGEGVKPIKARSRPKDPRQIDMFGTTEAGD